MPWMKMRLRDAEVLARVDDAGRPLAHAGRVEIRYQRAGKAYHAAVANLQPVDGAALLGDEHCEPATSEPPRAGAPDAARAPSKTATQPAWRAGPTREAAARSGPVEAPEGALVAYADGACSGNPGPAGLGLVVIDGPRVVERSEYLGTATNNIAELTAVKRALEATRDSARPLWIYTDSQYAIGVLTKGWKAKANQELIAELRAMLSRRLDVRFVYVPGHAGVALNEKADELARLAVTSRKSSEQTRQPPST